MVRVSRKTAKIKSKGKVGVSQAAFEPVPLDKMYLSFCLRWLDIDRKNITEDDRLALIKTLCKLSSLSWKEIRISGRHTCGYEKIPVDSLAGIKLPSELFTGDVKQVDVFRFNGKKPMLGLLLPRGEFMVYYIIHLDTNFTAYRH